jgi:hypothetical protein
LEGSPAIAWTTIKKSRKKERHRGLHGCRPVDGDGKGDKDGQAETDEQQHLASEDDRAPPQKPRETPYRHCEGPEGLRRAEQADALVQVVLEKGRGDEDEHNELRCRLAPFHGLVHAHPPGRPWSNCEA